MYVKKKRKKSKKGAFHIGCSGWNYNHWKGLFYPEKSSSNTWFKEYSSHFSTVEINNTFYNLPETSVFDNWREQAPPGFIYAVKANRFITHMKKLKDPKKSLELFLSRTRLLKKHLGPVLFQLPPHWKVNTERFDNFTDLLPKDLECVFEFRDPSWYDEGIYRIMKKKKISLCLHDMPGSESPLETVGPICYIRFHGATGIYAGGYSLTHLKKWIRLIKEAISDSKDVYVYFNNDAEAHAPHDAEKLIKYLTKNSSSII